MVKIICLNVRGLQNERKRRIIFKYARDRTDIVLLQETHFTKQIQTVWKNEWAGKAIFAHGESNARGVCILFKKNICVNILKY